MTARERRIAAATVLFAATLVLIGGIVMWHDAPSRADLAVGKGLVVIGGAVVGSVLTALAFVWLDAVEARPHTSPVQAARSDWDDV